MVFTVFFCCFAVLVTQMPANGLQPERWGASIVNKLGKKKKQLGNRTEQKPDLPHLIGYEIKNVTDVDMDVDDVCIVEVNWNVIQADMFHYRCFFLF